VHQIRNWTNELVGRVVAAGGQVDAVALDHAVLLHDALFFVAAHRLGFSSKEELAATYACNTLRDLGAPEEHAVKVWHLIMATHVLVDPQTPEEVIIRAADLKNVGGDYALFRDSTKRLHREAGKLDEAGALLGHQISFELFVRRALRYLALYAWRFLQLTADAGKSQTSGWHYRAIRNMLQLFVEIHGGDRDKVCVCVHIPKPGHTTIIDTRGIRESEFFIGVVADDRTREEQLFKTHQLTEGVETPAPIIFIPGDEHAARIPDGECDRLYLERAFSISEVQRVLRPQGTVILLEPDVDVTELIASGFAPAEALTDMPTARVFLRPAVH
jgi:hypothetical protein